MSPNGLTSPEQTVSASERREMLRQRARLNRSVRHADSFADTAAGILFD